MLDPPQGVFYWEQLAMFTNRRERGGSFSFFFAYNVPQEICAFPQNVLRVRVACFDVFQHLLPDPFRRFPRPNRHFFRFPNSPSHQSSIVALMVTTTSRTHLCFQRLPAILTLWPFISWDQHHFRFTFRSMRKEFVATFGVAR